MRILLLACVLLSSPLRADGGWLPEAAVRALAIETLEEGEAGGSRSLTAALEPSPDDFSLATLSVVLADSTGLARSDQIRVSFVLDRFVGEPLVIPLEGDGEPLDGGCWRLDVRLLLPEDLREIAVVSETVAGWGSTVVEEEGGLDSGCVQEQRDLVPRAAPERRPEDEMMRLLPVTSTVTGKYRFQVLTVSEAVREVVFYLDGKEVARDPQPPFTARIDLGAEAVRHTLRAEGLTRDGIVLDEDEIVLNTGGDRLSIRIARIEPQPEGTVRVAAELNLPPDAELEEVEFYLSEQRVGARSQPPFEITFAGPEAPDGTEFIRVVARLADGSWIEDASLLSGSLLSEKIEVHLVELFVVVTDRDQRPVPALTTEDFRVRGPRRTEIRLERFGVAENLPLSLGLVIDTSESMWTLMPDTKKAAAIFLTEMLSPQDNAFIVDFDTQPRLARGTTSDLPTLLGSLSSLQPGGATAMYDAVVFGSLQFDEAIGRRALVLLTDGDDYQSSFSNNRAVQQARLAGAPVYIIALGGFDDFRRSLKTLDLDSLTSRTGGRVFYVGSMEEVSAAYRQIATELRSQYVLAVSTDRRLEPDEVRKIEVEIERPGLEARAAVNPLR